MQFVIVCILLIVGLAGVALIANVFDSSDDHCLIKENEERKKKEVARNKTYDELWDPDEDIKI